MEKFTRRAMLAETAFAVAPALDREHGTSVREILSEPAIAAQLRDTQQMTRPPADAGDFGAFFAKQVSVWGQVVRDDNIWA